MNVRRGAATLLIVPVAVGLLVFGKSLPVAFGIATSGVSGNVSASGASVPHYNHIFVIVEENHGFDQIIGDSAAPAINQLAKTYGLATDYTGVADPSAPNYVALIGGNFYGIADDNSYYTHTINKPSVVNQLEDAGLTWKGYFQSIPYAGFKGTCYPTRCNGVPDSDVLYASKHNGFPYFAYIQQHPQELQKMVPITELQDDLQAGRAPNFSFIVPDQCHDMHGSPPFCIDSATPGTFMDNALVTLGDTFAKNLVNEITGSSLWSKGTNAIVITWDEGNLATSRIPAIVITNHGPRGLRDNTSYNHYSLLLTVEKAFGLGCLQHTCDSNVKPMAPLFANS
jgi:phospholipase C